ncbi:MAG TPA: DNA-3-methyladenine glycosylase 2 family protein, partial [Ktedonobacteraceae bacterium]
TRLQALPGVGPWTAAYIAMRALSDPDAFPASDLGLRRAFEHYGLAADMKSIMQRAETWRPWRAYATQYLWTSLAIK